jgi:hypothetical protein
MAPEEAAAEQELRDEADSGDTEAAPGPSPFLGCVQARPGQSEPPPLIGRSFTAPSLGGTLCVLDAERRLHLLRPFLIAMQCPICRNPSTFLHRPADLIGHRGQEPGRRTHHDPARPKRRAYPSKPDRESLSRAANCLLRRARWSPTWEETANHADSGSSSAR